MKLAIITDIHFGVRNNSDYFLNQYEKFFKETFFPRLKEENITDVLILGDTWEDRSKLSSNTLHRAREMFFDPLRAAGINVKLIYGNHDVFFKDSNHVNTIDFIGDLYPNIEVVETHKVFDFDGLKIGMISWINKTNLQESLDWMNSIDAPYLCGHFEIRSFQMIKGQICEHGFEKEQFQRFERVFSGHFHYMSDDGRICYVSNPFQTNWSDYNLEKGFRILDTKTRELTTVYNPDFVYQKVVLDQDPDLLAYDYAQHQNKIVRVYVKSFGAVNQHKIHLFMEEMAKYAYSMTLEEFDENIVGILSEDGSFDETDTAIVIDSYIKEVINDETSIDKKKLHSMFMDLYNEASSVSMSD